MVSREEITRLAQEAGFVGMDGEHGGLRRFAALVAAAEREACAMVCDQLADMHEKMNQWSSYKTADTLAQAIRYRSQS
jgi:hypothetical protein